MTWWDHQTETIWSQPWGRAINGPLTGTELQLLPSQLVPWQTWREAHPDTLALEVDPNRSRFVRENFYEGYVIGVTLGQDATAFPYETVERLGIVNDAVGRYPVVVHVNGETRAVAVYVRQVDDQVLTFVLEDGTSKDQETKSTWNIERGIAVEGPLAGQALKTVPYIPAFPAAWLDFYPESRWYLSEE
jgi:hypothetical protein